ncbi:ribonuclease activity regulator RraA [Denitrobaculum tricleocarpae]|uniref:Ribonuclease activity regulator RraA n=1 Tax=Denitrobaculum tricleocarpae TaxID=2591009 RepID=A0A545TYE4_9PROT|nr:ribonuclease activity regulator RraA [Denitrobaculum tricleocarpae]TQV82229.1 ribonuclease activity regulator RraA [Denitrobaculum tricleocarpae]
MTHKILSDATLAAYRGASTASLCTLLYKRGLRKCFVEGVSRLNRAPIHLVGQAYTLRYIPSREDLNGIEVFRDPKHPQRVAVEAVPAGHVLVMDCRGDATAASAGAILTKRLEVRGCAGLVTDGGLRDAETIAGLEIPSFCARPSAPTNLTRHHAIDLNVPIGCGGAPVFPGDLMVGDGDGVVVVPLHLAEEIAEELTQMEAFEDYVFEQVSAGESIIGLYPPNEETLKRYAARAPKSGAEIKTGETT